MTSYKDLQEVFNLSKTQTIIAQMNSIPDDMINIICDFIPQKPYLKDLKTLFKLQKIWSDYKNNKVHKDSSRSLTGYTYVPKSWVDGSYRTYEEFCVDKVENLVCDKLRTKEQNKMVNFHDYKYNSSFSLYRKLLQKTKIIGITNINILPNIERSLLQNGLRIQSYNTIDTEDGNVKRYYELEKFYTMRDLKLIIEIFNIYVPSKYKKNKKLFIQYLIKNY